MKNVDDSAIGPLLPHPRLRIGVTGHRTGPKLSPKHEDAVRTTVERVLATVAAQARAVATQLKIARTPADAELVVISALAEGSDRIVAETGLATGFSLEAILPFERDIYAADFESSRSRAAFTTLLNRASSVLELSANREDVPHAYQWAGLVMLANTDLLIAVWDQNNAAGPGGTAMIVERAISERVPVILINPAMPEKAALLWGGAGEPMLPDVLDTDFRQQDAFDELPRVIDALLGAPHGEQNRAELAVYLHETEHRWSLFPVFPMLLGLFRVRSMQRTDFIQKRYLVAAREEWNDFVSTAPKDDRLTPAIDAILLPAFAFASNLSVYYAKMYRGAYVFNFIAAATAVFLALLGMFFSGHKELLGLLELGVMSAIIFTWFRGRKQEWHRRWLQYRRLADYLRQMRVSALLAAAGPAIRPDLTDEKNGGNWVDWYGRAIRRQLKLPNRKIDVKYLDAVRRCACLAEIGSQIKYHRSNASRMAALDHRLHWVGTPLFAATALICGGSVLLILVSPGLGGGTKEATIFLTAFLPALGAALHAIRVQGDFETVARRSAKTADRLERILTVLANDSLTFSGLTDRIERMSDVMAADLAEWHMIFRTRPLSLPG